MRYRFDFYFEDNTDEELGNINSIFFYRGIKDYSDDRSCHPVRIYKDRGDHSLFIVNSFLEVAKILYEI